MVKSSSVATARKGTAAPRTTTKATKAAPTGEKPTCRHDDAPARRGSVGTLALARAAALFRACGDPERLRLLERLSQGEFCVSELAAESGEGLSTVSQRLRLLRTEGLVSRRREGKHIYYALSDQHVADLIQSALEHALEPRSHAHTGEEDE
ncbi:ArsR/SmtB family transcription factor [Sandaracinus amylolyticus]|uniref:Transcriptional regulator, ArsR family protein n=1 Tax=Sandaracinus amylolyticus TaxID=927083 RepID=A0A0F6WA91_9BACT|nr:metalloregulator ArsR/SmtB family transcription factor [Sandaracinus amylolyticus]AKF11418.1 Transcriptional regulator, ArsR family protein [Sandaracinus amylolyticus]